MPGFSPLEDELWEEGRRAHATNQVFGGTLQKWHRAMWMISWFRLTQVQSFQPPGRRTMPVASFARRPAPPPYSRTSSTWCPRMMWSESSQGFSVFCTIYVRLPPSRWSAQHRKHVKLAKDMNTCHVVCGCITPFAPALRRMLWAARMLQRQNKQPSVQTFDVTLYVLFVSIIVVCYTLLTSAFSLQKHWKNKDRAWSWVKPN